MSIGKDRPEKLKILIQVNTSGEPSKSGCDMTAASALFGYVLTSCDKLSPTGLMTIGRLTENNEPPPIDCFQVIDEIIRGLPR